MSENSNENPSKEPRFNLNNLPEVEVPPRSPLAGHEPPIAVTRNWIAGDFTGLHEVAQELYTFGTSSHSEVTELARYVEGLIGESGHWKSNTADAFRWSFGGDATLINDLAQVAVAIGRVIDSLASGLASLEAKLDNILAPRIASGVFMLESPPDNENFIVVAKRLDGQPVIAPRRGRVGQVAVTALQAFVAAQRKAKRIRQEAGTQIAALCEPVNKNLGLYTSPDGQQREREGQGQGPLRHDQVTRDQGAINSLQQQFKAAVSGNDSGISRQDVDQALGDIGKFGGDVNTIGGVVSDIKAMQHAGEMVQAGKIGGAVQEVSGVVRDLLALLEKAPK